MAPASNVTATSEDDEGEGPLGRTVHSIRGSISNFQFHMPTTQRFPNCTACSREVLDSFAASGFELLHQTSKNSKHLEDLTGLSSLMSETNFEDIIECSDDDDF
jgi:ubiquitin-like modifier-activating enzyme ATG7